MARLQLPSADQIPGGRAFASLSRRVRTLIVTGLLFVVLFALIFTLPVPYVVLSPGPTYNTIGKDDRGQTIIMIGGTKANATSGNLNMTTVGVSTDSITAYQALKGWLYGDEVVVPRSSVYPPGESPQQTDQQNTRDFVQSQDNATAAAFCELGFPKGFGIIQVSSDGPSAGALKPGDAFVSVAGTPVGSRSTLDKILQTKAAGTKVAVVVKRGSKTIRTTVTLGAPPKQQGAPQRKGGYLGVVPDNTCLAPFTVRLGLASQIGGPSAGLMFALGIIDKVGRVDLTKGRFIAGTGTIEPDGKVGPIGGIALKMIAARRKGATVFLAPAANCPDVRKATPNGLRVVKVATLHDASQDLVKIENGKDVPGC